MENSSENSEKFPDDEPGHCDPLPNGDSIPHPPPFLEKAPFRVPWTNEEHLTFLKGLHELGRGRWKEISERIGTKKPNQVQIHAQRVKYSVQNEFS